MQNSFRSKIDYLVANLKCYIKENRRFLFFHLLAILCGLVLGIIICSLRENITSKYNYIVLISNEEFNLFGTFIKVVLLSIVGIVLCYLPIYHKYLACLPYIVLFYTAYRFGGRVVGIIVADKIIGFICIITFTIPLYLVILVGFVICSCISANYKATCGSRGLVCKNINKQILKYNCCVAIGLLVLLIVICIIIPAIAKFIIVV